MKTDICSKISDIDNTIYMYVKHVESLRNGIMKAKREISTHLSDTEVVEFWRNELEEDKSCYNRYCGEIHRLKKERNELQRLQSKC